MDETVEKLPIYEQQITLNQSPPIRETRREAEEILKLTLDVLKDNPHAYDSEQLVARIDLWSELDAGNHKTFMTYLQRDLIRIGAGKDMEVTANFLGIIDDRVSWSDRLVGQTHPGKIFEFRLRYPSPHVSSDPMPHFARVGEVYLTVRDAAVVQTDGTGKLGRIGAAARRLLPPYGRK